MQYASIADLFVHVLATWKILPEPLPYEFVESIRHTIGRMAHCTAPIGFLAAAIFWLNVLVGQTSEKPFLFNYLGRAPQVSNS
jgi:hypothetical protein